MSLNKVLLPVSQHGKPRERKPPPHPRTSNLPSPVTAQRAHPQARNLTLWTYAKTLAMLHTYDGTGTTPKVLCALSYLLLVSPLLGRQCYSVTFARGLQWGNQGRGIWWCKAHASGNWENSESILLLLLIWFSDSGFPCLSNERGPI